MALRSPTCLAFAVLSLVAVDGARAGDRLLGDPGGARTRLERLGVELQLFYQQWGSIAAGGADASGAELGASGSYDLFARVDLGALAGWRGADLLVHGKGQWEDSVNRAVGALSDPIDDADFDGGSYIAQLWLQQALFDGRVRARLGYMEQQVIFDRNAYANSEDRQFAATFLDNDGVVPLVSGLAATLLVAPAPWLELALGVADADNRPRRTGFESFFDGAESLTAYAELRLSSPWESRGLPGAYRLGVLRDGRDLTEFSSGDTERGHIGAWLSFDQLVWRRGGEAPGGARGLGVFARVGWADPDVSRAEWFWSLGVSLDAPLPARPRDVLGFGVYQARGSERYRDHVDAGFDSETGFELYYAVAACGWLVVTPDLQYIVDPGAHEGDDAFVATLRVRVSF